MTRALDHVRAQIEAGRQELLLHAPGGSRWHELAMATAGEFVPWISRFAPTLRSRVGEVLAVSQSLREAWAQASVHVPSTELRTRIERLLDVQAALVDDVPSNVISSVISDILVESYPGARLAANGASDYPDLYLTHHDYSFLPRFDRSGEYGAAIKDGRPVRIANGIEIKTTRGGRAVDCHAAHPGLHLAAVVARAGSCAVVSDVKVGFLVPSDYRESGRNTQATTVKHTFRLDKFVSVFN